MDCPSNRAIKRDLRIWTDLPHAVIMARSSTKYNVMVLRKWFSRSNYDSSDAVSGVNDLMNDPSEHISEQMIEQWWVNCLYSLWFKALWKSWRQSWVHSPPHSFAPLTHLLTLHYSLCSPACSFARSFDRSQAHGRVEWFWLLSEVFWIIVLLQKHPRPWLIKKQIWLCCNKTSSAKHISQAQGSKIYLFIDDGNFCQLWSFINDWE